MNKTSVHNGKGKGGSTENLADNFHRKMSFWRNIHKNGMILMYMLEKLCINWIRIGSKCRLWRIS
jgi:hypothetical protein